MAMDDVSSDSGVLSQINVTPLVDVMLVLLVIFMVAAPILQQGVELELPRETIAPLESSDGEQLVVSIDREGRVYIGQGNEVQPKDVGTRLHGILEKRADKRVYLKADRRVNYGTVMAVMGSIRRSGIDKVGLITEPS